MYSMRCTYCHQLINLKTEEVRDAIEQAEAAHDSLYTLHCPNCRRVLKVQVKDLKRKLPIAITLPTPGEKHEEQPEAHEEPEAQPEPEAQAEPAKPARKSRAKK